MGLLSRIEGADYNKVKSASSVLTYFEFISKHTLEICGVFKKSGLNFVLSNSYGLDIKSIINSKSTEDFWSGLIENDNQIYVFKTEDDTIQTVYQFFSFKMRDVIKSVILYKNKESIYMICNTNEDEKDYKSIFQDFVYYDTFNFYTPATKLTEEYENFVLDFGKAISVELEKMNINSDIYSNCIINQIFNNLQSYFPAPNTVELKNNTISISMKAASAISDNLFLSQIKENLKDFLTNSVDEIIISK